MTNYLVYGTVRSIEATRIGGFLGMFGQSRPVAVLSTGHKIVCTDYAINANPEAVCATDLKVGKSYFFGVSGDKQGLLYFQSRRECTELNKLDKLSRNLEDASKRAIHATESLNVRDRGLVFQSVGITIAGAFSAINAVNALGCISSGLTGTMEPTSALTGGLVSSGCAVAGGIYTYLQYEALTENLKTRADLMSEYVKAHKLYSKLMNKYIPVGYADAEPLNAQVHSLIEPLRKYFTMSRTKADGIRNFFKANIQFQVA